MLIDTHCHLDFPEYDQDREQVIRRAQEAGVNYFINIGSNVKASQDCLALAKKYPPVYASVGIHPHQADNLSEDYLKIIKDLAKEDKVVAIGEIGLDYYRNFSKVDNQKRLFISLIKLAKELNLPLVLHSRQAETDSLNILKDFFPLAAVVHCFSGSESFLKNCLDSGFYISFTCNVTYKKSEELRKIVKLCPLDRLMLETDCPFLSPEGFRGKRNEPLQVRLLAEEIAKNKAVSFQEVAAATSENAKKFFKLQ